MSLHQLKKYIAYFTYYSWLNLKSIAELTDSSKWTGKAAFARGIPRLKFHPCYNVKDTPHFVQYVQ